MKPLKLNGEANIYEISVLQEKILKAWDGASPLKLDLSKVEDIDASFVQLLLSCKRKANEKSQVIEWVELPDSLREKLDALYVSDFLFSDDSKITVDMSESTESKIEDSEQEVK